jgi:DNA-binding NtrC family response regulator
MRLLLIEDDTEMQSIISGMLRKAEYEIVAASSIAEAEQHILGDLEFDVALVDFWIGAESSVSLLDLLQSHRASTPVIMITGGGHGVPIETSMAIGEVSGAVQFLQNPFLQSELLSVLQACR